MRRCVIILLLSTFFANGLFAGCSAGDTSLQGTWKGTPICQVKPSACNDEIAVYHITKGMKPGIYHIVANKVINGKEEDMAEDDFVFNAAKLSLFCYIEKYKVTIQLFVKGNTIEGTLGRGKTVDRIIKLQKVSS